MIRLDIADESTEQPVTLSATDRGNSHVHILPARTLIGVFVTLVLLTIVTMVAASVDLGQWEVGVSLGIASVKAALVALYFMHLRYDKPFNAIVFLSAVLCLWVFLAFLLSDVKAYQDLLQ